MTNRDFGRAYIKDARLILAEAETSLEQGHFHRTVRKCQESVEMALKGLLRMAGMNIRRLIGWVACCWSQRSRRWSRATVSETLRVLRMNWQMRGKRRLWI